MRIFALLVGVMSKQFLPVGGYAGVTCNRNVCCRDVRASTLCMCICSMPTPLYIHLSTLLHTIICSAMVCHNAHLV